VTVPRALVSWLLIAAALAGIALGGWLFGLVTGA
jgi:hypothetical protein